MHDSANIVGPLFYGHVAFGALVAGGWFYRRSTPATRGFGVGLFGFAVAFVIWTIANIIQPNTHDLKIWMTVGAAPFLISALAFARVGWRADGKETQSIGMIVAFVAVVATFIVRTFVVPSHPHFSAAGWLYFGIDPAAAACYIATLTLTFLPAINVVSGELDSPYVKRVVKVCLTALFIDAVVVFASRDNPLLEINSVVATLFMAVLWISCAVGFGSKRAVNASPSFSV